MKSKVLYAVLILTMKIILNSLTDFNQSMLNELSKKKLYGKVICCKLGDSTDSISGIHDGSYDIVVIAGGFAHGHLDIQVLRQAAKALKPG